MLRIVPCTFRDACKYIKDNHRHHPPTTGCKFCVSVYNDDLLVGVAVAGRPVSRYLDDGFTLEINRVCTDGTRNACSMLYGACVRIAKDMGYKKVITYILDSESGASVKAANFVEDGITGGVKWTGERDRQQPIPPQLKKRFSYIIER